MSDWHLVDDGSWNGVRKYIAAGDEPDSVLVRYEDTGAGQQIIEENKRADPINKKADRWHVGHIPASLGLKWMVEEGFDMWNPANVDAVKRKLMDSDYRHLVPGLARIIF